MTQVPVYPGSPANKLSVAAPSLSIVSPRLADALFMALACGPVDADESAVLGRIAEPVLYQGLTTQASEARSQQVDLDRLFWDRGESNWLDGEQDWLF